MYIYTQIHFPMVLDALEGFYLEHFTLLDSSKDIVIAEITYNLEFQSNPFLAAKATEQLLPSI